MLTELYISNLAVIEDVLLRLGPGLTVLTGETGAGKSLVVSAIDLALGARSSVGIVRKGAPQAEIIARFELKKNHPRAQDLEEDLEEGALVLRRVVGADGRSRCYVNDRPSTVGRLRELGKLVADLHGQHEQQNLGREETHLDYLDGFAECEALTETMAAAQADLWKLHGDLESLRQALRQSMEERDFLTYQLEELERADLRPGETETLDRERSLAAHSGRLAENTGLAIDALTDGDTSSLSQLHAVARHLAKAAELDPSLAPLQRQLDEALVTAEDLGRELTGYVAGINSDPGRLEEIENRLQTLAGLRRKYATDEDGLIAKRDSLQQQMDSFAAAPEEISEREEQVGVAATRLQELSTELSSVRSRAAARLSRSVSKELQGLGMEGARFWVDLNPVDQGPTIPGTGLKVSPRGFEEAAFMLAANPGEAGGSIGKIASGGEMSRVMLALKNVLGKVDPVPLVIFDEVDSGISGLVAESVGSRLTAIAKKHQVLVVTHLAVIAGRGDHHVRFSKTTAKGRTRVDLEELTGTGREEELARMMAGSSGGKDARQTARSILAEGKSQ